MTRWAHQPLRPEGQPWPGLNTRDGRIDPGVGQMADCTNVVIDRGDVLEKRRGFIRGLNERFLGPVCGLFPYLDSCGQEWLVVAHESGIAVRQPFDLILVQTADCYPVDNFEGAELSADWIEGAAGYAVAGGALVRTAGPDFDDLDTVVDNALRWFKPACAQSYRLNVQFEFQAQAIEQRIAIVLKEGDSGACVLGLVTFTSGGNYQARLLRRGADQQFTLLDTLVLTGQPSGFLQLSYAALTRKATLTVNVTGGTVGGEIEAELTEAQHNDLGQGTGVSIWFAEAMSPTPKVLAVEGDRVG